MALELVIATRNPAKAERLRELCVGINVVFHALNGQEPTVDETGGSHLANAVRKAVAWSGLYKRAALASDGGLVIPALGDEWESLLTRRATGGDVSDEEHARRLLARMRDLEGERREAYWAEALAIARSGVVMGAWEVDGLPGRVASAFLPAPNGPSGFWADGLWETLDGRRRWELGSAELEAHADPWSQLTAPVRDMLSRMI